MHQAQLPFADPARLADDLGRVRDEMMALKARADALRAALIAARPNGPVVGAAYRVTVRTGTARRFDQSLLPAHIREDPRYFRLVTSQTVVARPLGPEDLEEEDIVLIEPF